MKSKIFLLFLFFYCSVFAQGWSPVVGTSSTSTDSKVSINTEIIISLPSSNDDILSLPLLKEGYYSSIESIDYLTGTITFYIFHDTKIIGRAEYTNQNVLNSLLLSADEKKELVKDLNNVDDKFQHRILSQIEKASDIQELNFGLDDVKYISTSRYFISALLLDASIFDFESTIQQNKIILRPDVQVREKEISSKLNNMILVFYVSTMYGINDFLLEFKLALMMVVLISIVSYAFHVAKTGFEKIELLERGTLVVFMLMFFYISVNIDGLSRTNFQHILAQTIGWGVEKADALTAKINQSYLRHQSANVGLNAKENIQLLKSDIVLQRKEREHWSEHVKMCDNIYDKEKIWFWASQSKSAHFYPTTEALLEGSYSDSYFLKESNKLSKYSMTLCRLAEIREKQLIKEVHEKEEAVKKWVTTASNDSRDIATLDKLVEVSTNNARNLGFLHSGFIALQESAIRNMLDDSMLSNHLKSVESPEGTINKILYNLSYMMMPGFSGLTTAYEKVGSVAMNSVAAVATRGMSTRLEVVEHEIKQNPAMTYGGVRSNPTIKPEVVEKPTLTSKVSNAFNDFKRVFQDMNSAAAFALALYTMQEMSKYLSFIALATASILVFAYFSVSVIVFFVVAPFWALYLFVTNQMEKIKEVMIHTISLAVRPVLLVLAVFISIIITLFFDAFSGHLMTKEFNDTLSIVQTHNTGIISNTFDEFITSFLKGFVAFILQIIAIIAAFYTMLRLPSYIIELMGGNAKDSRDILMDSERNKTLQNAGF
ncbi:MAG: hypothetical protein AB7E13_00715 [Arcobacteraceae bacterium]